MGPPGRLTTLAAMRGTTRPLVVLGLVAAVAVLSACGSDEFDGRIPQSDAEALRTSLDQVRNDVSAGECDSASSGAQAFVDGVNALPESATTELKEALRTAGEQLERLVSEECAVTGTTTTSDTTSTDTSSTDTTTSSTETTTTTDTSTSTDTTTSTDTEPDEDGGPSGGGGGSGGGGDTGGGGGTGGSGGTHG